MPRCLHAFSMDLYNLSGLWQLIGPYPDGVIDCITNCWSMVGRAFPSLFGAKRPLWIIRLDDDRDNLRHFMNGRYLVS